MNLKDIKNLINEESGKLIIADENGPIMVIMSYSDYKKSKNISNLASIDNQIEQLPIAKNISVSEEKKESFGIEDLPF
ncbi:MAG: hypothetical protein PHR47_04285 [Candidatus Pacebacteria bacterium]|nr:hypothetical protein [Candidatus Paceibacterota bacterium]